MKINLQVNFPGYNFHFYRRQVGTRQVFTIYLNGTSIWQEVKMLEPEDSDALVTRKPINL